MHYASVSLNTADLASTFYTCPRHSSAMEAPSVSSVDCNLSTTQSTTLVKTLLTVSRGHTQCLHNVWEFNASSPNAFYISVSNLSLRSLFR